MASLDLNKLQQFIQKASSQTYAAGGEEISNPQREGFIELVFNEGDFSYRDSYTGYFRSWGTELVRIKGEPVWTASYGGGIMEEKEDLSHQTFNFLKKAFLKRDQNSFRGPENLKEGDWEYKYTQEGDVSLFNGYEEIHFKGELVFFHRVIGGLIKPLTQL